jgi:hypothetical protein
VAVELLWLVLTGQLPEAVLLQQQQQLQAVVTVLQKLHELAAAPAAAAGAVREEGLSDAAAGQCAGEDAAGPVASDTSSSSAGVPWSKLVSSLQVCEVVRRTWVVQTQLDIRGAPMHAVTTCLAFGVYVFCLCVLLRATGTVPGQAANTPAAVVGLAGSSLRLTQHHCRQRRQQQRQQQ